MIPPARLEPFDPLFVDVGPRMHAASWGKGDPTFVLVHGLGGSHMNWALAGGAFADKGRVLAVDLPGFGRTEPLERVTIGRMHAALERFIDKTCKGPVVLVGHSMGGVVSVLHAALRPETVRALVLVAPALPPPPGKLLSLRNAVTLATWMLPVAGPWLLGRRAAHVGPEGTVRDLLRVTVQDLSAVRKDVLDAHVDFARTRPERPWLDASLSQASRSLFVHMTRRWRVHRWMERITAPTLVIHGDHDRLIPLATAQNAIARCPAWQLEVLENVGHAPPIEAPDRFIELVLRFAAINAP